MNNKDLLNVKSLLNDDARYEIWKTKRDIWNPKIYTVYKDENLCAAALVAGRRHSAQKTVIDIYATYDDNFKELVLQLVKIPDQIVLHCSERPAFGEFKPSWQEILSEQGFEQQQQPVPSVASTKLEDPTGVKVWSRWAAGKPTRIAPYFGQTTEVTCGAVTALTAFQILGGSEFSQDHAENRAREISFWRAANNMPACEPVGLAVETFLSGSSANLIDKTPRVVISTEEPILLEEFPADDYEYILRRDLQEDSLRMATKLNIPIEYRWPETNEIFDLVASGKLVFLLISLKELINDPTPHWVLAYDVVDDHLIISDPWVQYPNGETWADTFAMPLSRDAVDLIARFGDPEYRSIIVLE